VSPISQTPETDREIFLHGLPKRSGHQMGEFGHFMAGAAASDWKPGLTVKQQAQRVAKLTQRGMPAAWLRRDPRAPENVWMSSAKVRHVESTHLPEYAGWHRRAQGDPTGDHFGPPNNPSLWKAASAPKVVSRGPKVMPHSTIQLRGKDLEWNSNSSWSLPQ
jgi:hypothetical protein